MSPNERAHYDMVIVGSGISCTAFLLRFLEKLLNANHSTKVISIAVVEKNHEFWKGIPYGKRSSLNSLTITNLGDFIPPAEKDAFLCWLKENHASWTAELRENAGNTGKHWLKNNSSLIENGRWDEVYIPRHLFGKYVSEKILAATHAAAKKGVATVVQFRGEAIDLACSGNDYELTTEDDLGCRSSIAAKTVILAIGSPPTKVLQPDRGNHACEYIQDIYEPSLESNLQKIQSLLGASRQPHQLNVLVIGSNASSLELIYMVETTPGLRAQLNHLVVLSNSGKLPHLIGPPADISHRFENVLKLNSQARFTATELIAAFEKDVDIAEQGGIDIGNICHLLNALVVEMLKKMDEIEQKYFYGHHGQRFARLVRRAGADYRDAAESLKQGGKLVLLKGSFHRLEPYGTRENGARAIYTLNGSHGEISCPLEFHLVINCGGTEELGNSSSRLIKGLVAKGLCAVNDTRKGVEVTEDFEAVKGLYVIGPLLGGIFNSQVRLWHVENAKSVFRLGDLLADKILRQLVVN